jgi:ribonuclease P protein component
MDRPGFGFPCTKRIRSSAEYGILRNKGRKRHTRNFIVYLYVRENGGPARLGLTVSRKVGRAVTRNRVKRLVREFFRLNQACFGAGVDISIISKPGAANLGFREVCDELFFLTRQKMVDKSS